MANPFVYEVKELSRGGIMETKTPSSLSRIWKHTQENGIGFGIITSWRYVNDSGVEMSMEENKTNLRSLKKKMSSSGYAHIELVGYWSNPKGSESGEEPSLFIPNKKVGGDRSDIQELNALLKELAVAYSQTGYILGDGEKVRVLDRHGKVTRTIEKSQPNQLDESYSTLKGKQKGGGDFHFTKIRKPTGWMDAMGRASQCGIWSFKWYQYFLDTGYTSEARKAVVPRSIKTKEERREMWKRLR